MATTPCTTTTYKSVKQNYSPTPDLLELLEDFRLMVNDCIRIALREEDKGNTITSMRRLSLACYHHLSAYDVCSCYRLTAISMAAGILSAYRRSMRKNPNTKRPCAWKSTLTDCYGFKVEGRRLRLTLRPHQYAYIDLNPHTLRAIAGYKLRSVRLTPNALSICYSRDVEEIKPRGMMGIDRNLDNVTVSTETATARFDLSKATRIKSAYREVQRRFTRNDVRIRRKVFTKYGTLQRNRVGQILHMCSKHVVAIAKEDCLAIVMEDLRGLRRLYKRGNGQGARYRARMNSWSYGELQRQIEYKARWEGIPIYYVAARGTSARCSICGRKTFPNGDRTLYCPGCRRKTDRDVNAARNILQKGLLRFGSDGPPSEAMVGEPRRAEEVIPKVDGRKMTNHEDTWRT